MPLHEPIVRQRSVIDQALNFFRISGFIILGWLGLFLILTLMAWVDFGPDISIDSEILIILVLGPILVAVGMMIIGLGFVLKGEAGEWFKPMTVATVSAYGFAGLGWVILFFAALFEMELSGTISGFAAFAATYGWLASAIMFAAFCLLFAMYYESERIIMFASYYLIAMLAYPVWLVVSPIFIVGSPVFDMMTLGRAIMTDHTAMMIVTIISQLLGMAIVFVSITTIQLLREAETGGSKFVRDVDDDGWDDLSDASLGPAKKKKKKRRPQSAVGASGPTPGVAKKKKKKKKARPASEQRTPERTDEDPDFLD